MKGSRVNRFHQLLVGLPRLFRHVVHAGKDLPSKDDWPCCNFHLIAGRGQVLRQIQSCLYCLAIWNLQVTSRVSQVSLTLAVL